jgi:hypothetical protein
MMGAGMDMSFIKGCWDVIKEMDPSEREDFRNPLKNIDPFLGYYGMELPIKGKESKAALDISTLEPGYKALTHETLLTLRENAYSGQNLQKTGLWAEKLMRFCEVRLASLRARGIEKCKSLVEAKLLYLHLAVFLLDYWTLTGDPRYLNTTLKLADLRWIVDRRTLIHRLRGSRNEIIGALFEFRVLLNYEYAMDKLSREGMR